MLFLQEHQVSSSFAAKIYKQYGNDSIAVMKENPYRLEDDIWGIGFKTADQIAEKLGFGKESYVRLRSGLMYTLSELSNDGHVYAEKQQLIDKASEFLEASPETVIMTMDEMIKQEELIQEKNITKTDEDGNSIIPIYLPPFYFAEIGVAGKLKKLAASPAGDQLYVKLMEARRESVVPQIVDLVKKKLPNYYHVQPTQIQVLTPMQSGVVGATNLNLSLQEALNPAEHEVFLRGRGATMMQKECLRRSGFVFRADDKVMQIRNNYTKEVYNGDIGIIEAVNVDDRTLKVNFDDRIVEYDVTELDELVHAYATTIHKAQGSEYPIVVMPILMNHYVMLQRNLIYTGITRAKKILVLVGTKKALSYAVRNVMVTKRNTLLKERLQG
jgi:ATP-dependent exoDNAse (exonuclease V) alpha subunit